MFDDVDQELGRMAGAADFPHRATARSAQRFRADGAAADLVAILDDPHACGTTEILFAMAGAQRPWLNWVPMPSEAITNLANGAVTSTGLVMVSLSAMHSAAPPSRNAANTESSNHDLSRNSNAGRSRPCSIARKSRKRGTSRLKLGGN